MKRKFIVTIESDLYYRTLVAYIRQELNLKTMTVKPYKEQSSCEHWKTDGIPPKWCWKKPPKIKYPICKQCDLSGNCHDICDGFKEKKPKGRE